MKKGAPHPDSKPPVHKVQHSDTYEVNNCLYIDHSCSHLPAVNPAIFQGVTFNNFGSGLVYGSKKKKSTKCHFQTSFMLSYALCQYNVRLSATQKENANYSPTA